MCLHKRWLLVLLGIIAVLPACSLLPHSGGDRTQLVSVRVVAAPDAKASSATALDLVFVYDANTLHLIPGDAPEWFERKASLMQGMGRDVDVVSLQLPPASAVDPVKLPSRHGQAIAVYAFADYPASGGRARMDLGGYRHATVWLERSAVRLSEP